MASTNSRRSSITINGQHNERVNSDQPRVGPYDAETTVAILGVVQAAVSAETGNQTTPGRGDREQDRLLNGQRISGITGTFREESFVRAVVWLGLTAIFIFGLVFMLFFVDLLGDSEWVSWWTGRLPKDPMLVALQVMENSPVIVRLFSAALSNYR